MQKNDLLNRINNYLRSGGLFNPEVMESKKVLDLIMDCKNFLESDSGSNLSPCPVCGGPAKVFVEMRDVLIQCGSGWSKCPIPVRTQKYRKIGDAEKEWRKISDFNKMKEDILRWFCTGHIGASSMAMATHLAGYKSDRSYPCDPGDFSRCVSFLDAVPSARKNMDKLRSISPTWDVLVDNWSKIESVFFSEVGHDQNVGKDAPKTYRLMKKLGL